MLNIQGSSDPANPRRGTSAGSIRSKKVSRPESMASTHPDLFSGKGKRPAPASKTGAGQQKKRKSRKKKFYHFHFALSDKEKHRYERLCLYEKTGFKRLVKKALKFYYEQAGLHDLPAELENQLDLFSPTDLFGHPVPGKKRGK